jgi:hypothetical protein
MNDITEQYLMRVYDDFKKEEDRLLNDIKTGCEADKQKDNYKQINIIHHILVEVLKLNTLKKKNYDI